MFQNVRLPSSCAQPVNFISPRQRAAVRLPSCAGPGRTLFTPNRVQNVFGNLLRRLGRVPLRQRGLHVLRGRLRFRPVRPAWPPLFPAWHFFVPATAPRRLSQTRGRCEIDDCPPPPETARAATAAASPRFPPATTRPARLTATVAAPSARSISARNGFTTALIPRAA